MPNGGKLENRVNSSQAYGTNGSRNNAHVICVRTERIPLCLNVCFVHGRMVNRLLCNDKFPGRALKVSDRTIAVMALSNRNGEEPHRGKQPHCRAEISANNATKKNSPEIIIMMHLCVGFCSAWLHTTCDDQHDLSPTMVASVKISLRKCVAGCFYLFAFFTGIHCESGNLCFIRIRVCMSVCVCVCVAVAPLTKRTISHSCNFLDSFLFISSNRWKYCFSAVLFRSPRAPCDQMNGWKCSSIRNCCSSFGRTLHIARKAPDMTNGTQSGIQFMKLVCHTIVDQASAHRAHSKYGTNKRSGALISFWVRWKGGESASQMRKANIAVCDWQQQKMFIQYNLEAFHAPILCFTWSALISTFPFRRNVSYVGCWDHL